MKNETANHILEFGNRKIPYKLHWADRKRLRIVVSPDLSVDIFAPKTSTSIELKSRMPELQGIKGEAVVVYRNPLITQEMGYHRLSRRVNKMKIKIDFCTSLIEEFPNVK